MEKQKKTAVIYARQSFGMECNSLSIESQLEQCRAWCKRNDAEIIAECYDTNTSSELYDDSDEGRAYSRIDKAWNEWKKQQKTANRRIYRKGLADAFSFLDKVDYFVVNERTRFYRNPSPLSYLSSYCLSKLQEHHVSLVEVESNKIDTLSSKIDIAVQQLLSAYEMSKVAEKREQSIRSRKRNIQKGIVFSNAYGIDWLNKKIHYNEDKAEVIRFVFNSVVEGKTYGEILFKMNSNFKHLADGKCFYETSIYKIIANPIYCGYKKLADGKYIEVVNLDNKPIVSFTMFQKANEIVKDKKQKSGKQKYNVKDQDKRHFLPFSGLLKCGNCGSKLIVGMDRGIVYFCNNTHLNKDKGCTPSRIRTDWDVDENDFLLVFQPLFLIRLQSFIYEYEKISNANEEKDKLQAEIENLKNKMKVIMDAFVSSNVDESVFTSSIEKLKKEIVEKENQLITLSSIADDEKEKELARFRKLHQEITDSENLIDNDDYARLLRETLQEVIIFQDKIKVVLFDGNSFYLPRLKANRRSKKLPNVSATSTFIPIDKSDRNKGGYLYHTITFSSDNPSTSTTLIETPYYKIILK